MSKIYKTSKIPKIGSITDAKTENPAALIENRSKEPDAEIVETKQYSDARAYGQYTGWESLRVWNSIWFLLPPDPGRRKQRWVAREGRVADHRHPRKGGAPRGVRLTRHSAGSSHSYCQLPTLRPSRSSLALDFGWFQPLLGCSSYFADVLFVTPPRNVLSRFGVTRASVRNKGDIWWGVWIFLGVFGFGIWLRS